VCSHSRCLRQLQAGTCWQWKVSCCRTCLTTLIECSHRCSWSLNTFDPGVFCYHNKTERGLDNHSQQCTSLYWKVRYFKGSNNKNTKCHRRV